MRNNDSFIYNFKDNEWSKVITNGNNAPCPRSGHSAVIYEDKINNDDFMYIFGGKNSKNQKLNDLWKLSLQSMTWTKLKVDSSITPRSGHSCDIYEDYILIYGGIYDVTRELNDLHIFDLKREHWICLFT